MLLTELARTGLWASIALLVATGRLNDGLAAAHLLLSTLLGMVHQASARLFVPAVVP